MITGCIFDVDGTLLDSMSIWKDLGMRYLRSLGKEPETGLAKILWTMSMGEAADYMKKTYHLEKSEDQIIQDVLSIVEHFYREEVKEKPGACAFLQKMHRDGIPMAIVTTNEPELVEMALKRMGVYDCFSAVYTCRELHTSKREPLIYETAAKSIGSDPSATMVFEDVLHAVKTAKKAGFLVTAIADEDSRRDWEEIRAIADYFAEDYEDIKL